MCSSVLAKRTQEHSKKFQTSLRSWNRHEANPCWCEE